MYIRGNTSAPLILLHCASLQLLPSKSTGLGRFGAIKCAIKCGNHFLVLPDVSCTPLSFMIYVLKHTRI